MPSSPQGAAAPPSLASPLLALPALDLRDVSKRFGPSWALARLSYSLPARTSLLLTGHNGSGKTTLLRLLGTAIAPTAGSAVVLGLDCVTQREKVRQRVALLSHSSFLYEDLTAEQNLIVLARLLGRPAPRDEAQMLLVQVGLSERTSSPVRHFSAGMRKRVAIARLLMKRPELALLDEPFGELDPSAIAKMEQIIADLQAAGAALVLATHLVEQGRALTQARLHLAAGRAVSP